MIVFRLELIFIGPQVFHNFMLALAWTIRTSENYTELSPLLVLFDLLEDEEPKHLIELAHEMGSWRNRIVLEIFLAVHILIIPIKVFDILLVVSCALKPSGSLVVHFGSWSYSIQRHKDHLGGL